MSAFKHKYEGDRRGRQAERDRQRERLTVGPERVRIVDRSERTASSAQVERCVSRDVVVPIHPCYLSLFPAPSAGGARGSSCHCYFYDTLEFPLPFPVLVNSSL